MSDMEKDFHASWEEFAIRWGNYGYDMKAGSMIHHAFSMGWMSAVIHMERRIEGIVGKPL